MFNSRSVVHSNVESSLFKKTKRKLSEAPFEKRSKHFKIKSSGSIESPISEDSEEDTTRTRLCAPIQETQKLSKLERKRSNYERKRKRTDDKKVLHETRWSENDSANIRYNFGDDSRNFNWYNTTNDSSSIDSPHYRNPKIRNDLDKTNSYWKGKKHEDPYISNSSGDHKQMSFHQNRKTSNSMSFNIDRQKSQQNYYSKSMRLPDISASPSSFGNSDVLWEEENVSKNRKTPNHSNQTNPIRWNEYITSYKTQQKVPCKLKDNSRSCSEINISTEKVSTIRSEHESSEDDYIATTPPKPEELQDMTENLNNSNNSTNERGDSTINLRKRDLTTKSFEKEAFREYRLKLDTQNSKALLWHGTDAINPPEPLFDAYNFDYSELAHLDESQVNTHDNKVSKTMVTNQPNKTMVSSSRVMEKKCTYSGASLANSDENKIISQTLPQSIRQIISRNTPSTSNNSKDTEKSRLIEKSTNKKSYEDIEIITISDDDSPYKNPSEPRKKMSHPDNKKSPNQNAKKNMKSKRTNPLKWISNIDDFMSCQYDTNIHPRMFGDFLPRLGHQTLLLIPWTQIEDFKYNCDTNPCLEI